MTVTADSAFKGRVTNDANWPDLTGNLNPVADEVDADDLEITGEIPTGLRGTYVRNGPNPMFEPVSEYHMFDGDGMLHGFFIGDDGVTFRNRWIRSKALMAEVGHGRSIYPGLSDLMNFPSQELTGDAGPVKNPANTHIVRHAGRLLALWEAGLPTEIAADLNSIGEHDFGGELRTGMTAHPRLDPRTGEMFFFAYSVFEPAIDYYTVDADGTLSHHTKVPLKSPVMMHDFVLTENYAVFLDSPIVFNVHAKDGERFVNWVPENGTRLGVMPRRGDGEEIRWFEIDNGHVQHFWNGWEDGNVIHLSGTRFERADFGVDSSSEDDRISNDEMPRPARFTIDLDAGTASWEQFDDLSGDFCRFNDDYTGVESRYEYMSAFMRERAVIGDFDSIVKYDAKTGERTHWTAGDHGHVGESVFAPDPAGTSEDDGWLLNIVYYDDTDRSDLVIIDARDVAAGPIATVTAPQRVPFGFHANWFAG